MDKNNKGNGRRITQKRGKEFLSYSILFREKTAPDYVVLSIIVILIFLFIFILWASILNLEELTSVQGSVQPADEIINIQHPEGGIIKEIYIKEGDLVTKGQELVRLDSLVSISQKEQAEEMLQILLARKERVSALFSGRAPDFQKAGVNREDIIYAQLRLYREQISQNNSVRQTMNLQKSQLELDLEDLRRNEKSLQEQIRLLEQEITIRNDLAANNLSPRTQVIALQREYEQLKTRAEQAPLLIRKMEEKLQEAETSLREYNTSLKRQYSSELLTIDEQILQNRYLMERYNQIAGRLVIFAPEDGYVHALLYKNIGEIVPAGGTVFKLIPIGTSYLGIVNIPPQNRGSIAVAMKVILKFSSYNYSRFGTMTGEIKEISPTTFLDSRGMPYYRSVITIPYNYLNPDLEKNPILPGMTFQADIQTGKKTLLQYLLKPIYTTSREAFHEK